ncbi:MAG: hypothetical protein HYX32_05855 [Actinobacteria bacterium]|nr:hypothetical protein [Actinomycetota bacterium]
MTRRIQVEQPVVADDNTIDTVNIIGRFIALVAAAVPTIIGLIALTQFDWTGTGFDSPAVNVAGMSFRPWLAIGTLILGVLAMAAASSWDRESRLFIGALFVAIGVVLFVANPIVEGVVLTNRMAWMFVLVGAVVGLIGLLTGRSWASRRTIYS